MKPLRRHAAALVVALPWLASAAQAQTEIVGRIEARLQIDQGCEVINGSEAPGGGNDFGVLDFGLTAPTWTATLGAQLSGAGGAGPLQVTCSPGVASFTVSIDGGLRGNRTLLLNGGSGANATDVVAYDLFSDAARTAAYPVGTPQSFPVPADGQPVDVPVFGAIPPNQGNAKASGLFTDTLLVTIDL